MLKNIQLENFRNHAKFKLELQHTTVLIGRNGVGKTNILEALVMLSFCRSFRSDDKRNLINRDCSFARIVGDDLELFLTNTPRLIMKAKAKGAPKRLSDFIGYLPSVIFSPETISIITGTPSDRRRFLDIMLSQVDREYLNALTAYRKVRQQRNSLLQRIGLGQAGEEELIFWDAEINREAEIISKKRNEAIDFINKLLPGIYQKISGDKSDNKLELKYLKNFEGALIDTLKQGRRREIAYGGTIFGPHRDDVQFNLNGFNMANFASRGELKSGILALKIGELRFLEQSEKLKMKSKENKVTPLLLLDDIFSEFDKERRSHLGDLILQYQSVITSTEKEHLSEILLKDAKIVDII